MMRAIGRPDLADDPTLADNAGRVQRTEELDRVDRRLDRRRVTLDEVLRVLEARRGAVGKIYDIADIVRDPHYQARGMIEQHQLGGKDL